MNTQQEIEVRIPGYPQEAKVTYFHFLKEAIEVQGFYGLDQYENVTGLADQENLGEAPEGGYKVRVYERGAGTRDYMHFKHMDLVIPAEKVQIIRRAVTNEYL